jgi:hypothetical protein
VSFATPLKYLGIYSASVVANQDAKSPERKFEFDFDAFRCRVAKGIHQRLATDPIDFIANHRVQRTWPAFHDDSEFRFPRDCQFLSNQ